MAGPLAGVRIVEFAGIGPGPFGGMLLADLGADVVLVDRPGGLPPVEAIAHRVLLRGRRSIAVDLKQPGGADVVLRLVERADAVIEGFRPGVAERLGVGPDACMARNPRLVYGRITGWGQDGPMAGAPGHDIDYIALAGALALIGRPGAPPTTPLNLLGDFAGGGMLLAVGILAGLHAARASGHGDIVDAAMVDGVAALLAMPLGLRAGGWWSAARGTNLLDGGAPFYDVYVAADGGELAVGALEERFYTALLTGLGLADEPDLPDRTDPANWPALRERFTQRFATRTRAQWLARFEGTEACVAPVLDPAEAARHPHLAARGTYLEADGVLQPAPAPRFQHAASSLPTPRPEPGAHTTELLSECGYAAEEIVALLDARVVT